MVEGAPLPFHKKHWGAYPELSMQTPISLKGVRSRLRRSRKQQTLLGLGRAKNNAFVSPCDWRHLVSELVHELFPSKSMFPMPTTCKPKYKHSRACAFVTRLFFSNAYKQDVCSKSVFFVCARSFQKRFTNLTCKKLRLCEEEC